ncbi:uncharacterized protein LOC118443588 [Vespa mandarinia]|uniref:uncharacterized protein LOC118443588 n=1 Tax=Vespa mandarinia TaxID=7446 RepID=UPI001607F220|nr:uncharacterized protein LOC118443588 [Vespa mandarinia]XP_035726699.1 uncharacterized protein LOC118443588 [Vespa mandarinia]XP_035726700.1 uncharacterized protein LOC118443588 [Vespa mandarinia]XP_035726701.1 uncharacterized protein LOC118443588 [Vespa mandarinia]
MKSFVRGLPSSSVLLRLLLIFLLIVAHHGRAEMEESNGDPIALLHKTLKYWRWIYETYREEIKLGYCWADYFLGSNDIETDFISRIIENELTNLKEMSIRRKCKNDSRYCEEDFSYGNPSRYGIDAKSSFRQNYVEEGSSKKDFEEISRANIEERYPLPQRATIDQEGNLENGLNHWSTLPNYPSQFTSRSSDKRSRRWSDHEAAAAAAAASVKVAYQGYSVKPKVFSLLNKKLTMDRESSSSETSSSTDTDVAGHLGFLSSRKVSVLDKGMARRSSYFDKTDREETTALSLSVEKYERNLDTLNVTVDQNRDRRSLKKNLKARSGRSFTSILSTTAEHPIFIEILRTLTVLARMGQLIIDIVDSSEVLRCTRDYILKKTIEWIDA